LVETPDCASNFSQHPYGQFGVCICEKCNESDWDVYGYVTVIEQLSGAKLAIHLLGGCSILKSLDIEKIPNDECQRLNKARELIEDIISRE
jgi:hypothetical protein